MNNKELSDLYYSANNISEGKHPPISTEKIMVAMRAAFDAGKNFSVDKTFEQAFAETGYSYGTDELEGVKLGWDLAKGLLHPVTFKL